jgi:ADP-heptose:LPS heptosyltransferase
MALDVAVPLLTNRPHLYFDTPAPPVEDFWLVCSGGKKDFTNKLWGQYNYQQVLNIAVGVKFVQVGGSEDDHPPLHYAENLVGRTTLRQLFDLCRRARGVLCGVSLLMHVAAALDKPAIVIAGGREPVAWNAYPRQQYLHTVGMLPCSSPQGDVGQACWRSRVVPLGDDTVMDRDTCQYPVNGTPTRLTRQTMPRCMSMIQPIEVAELLRRYNRQYEVQHGAAMVQGR